MFFAEKRRGSAMNVIPTAIQDVPIIEPNVYDDVRGFFFESFNPTAFHQATR